ncbi:PREDICTED: hepatitis A virus cellular receptor 2 [Chrysochloris asiatica]|uniref:Hepatitis A virus cellular receptor 2 n=1 Tax=Chrysochloris asiatica TaxID=185453 RepID=A0A9B0WPC4_CHRAS|nr:PREDICTED: hepatitis A virus cellular receptor 2 [Chrysochloris asiatica]
MFSHFSFDCILLLLLPLTRSLEVEEGQNAVLPCSYSPTPSVNLMSVCWGHGSCPLSQCHKTVLTTDGNQVTFQKSSRYQLNGYVHEGDVSLTIENVTLADSGAYCCRVQIPGPLNDKKLTLELHITPAKVATARTPWRDFTTIFPRLLTTKDDRTAEVQTLEILLYSNQTQKAPLANELQDSAVTTRIAVYIGVGISAGLALALIFGVLILKWHFHKKEKLQNSRLVSLASLSLSGLANAGAEGMRSEENIYTIEENVYEMEDPNEYYSYVSSEQRP